MRVASHSSGIVLRESVEAGDPEAIEGITRSSGFFSVEEVQVARELVEERLEKGLASGYYFVFAEKDGRVVAYACFGPIPCTAVSFDLYWIAAAEDYRGQGLGSLVLGEAERAIAKLGGRRIYVETSSKAQYEPTRSFYRRRGYVREAVLEDYYGPRDSKEIYVRVLVDV
mgnify:CR=1 FL=1